MVPLSPWLSAPSPPERAEVGIRRFRGRSDERGPRMRAVAAIIRSGRSGRSREDARGRDATSTRDRRRDAAARDRSPRCSSRKTARAPPLRLDLEQVVRGFSAPRSRIVTDSPVRSPSSSTARPSPCRTLANVVQVYILMKRYTASQLRARLSEALDEVERGGEVAVDRGKQTFRIVPGRPAAPTKGRRRKLGFQLTDERLLRGWTWEWQGPGRSMKLRVGGSPRRRPRA
jgi:antitoxin (DNA-binding transcriptional repressor) of toxin-antitoxin stability system